MNNISPERRIEIEKRLEEIGKRLRVLEERIKATYLFPRVKTFFKDLDICPICGGTPDLPKINKLSKEWHSELFSLVKEQGELGEELHNFSRYEK